MSTNELSLLMHSPIVTYAALGIYGLLMLAVVVYVQTKFRNANRLLAALKKDWDSAQSRHTGLVDHAQQQITRLAVPAAPQNRTDVNHAPVNRDMRNQVVTMGRKGINTTDIARSCGLSEGEVDVLLGMARIEAASR